MPSTASALTTLLFGGCCLDLVCWHQWFLFSQESCSR